MRSVHIATILLVCALVLSCASIDSLQPGGGMKFVAPNKNYDDVWKAAITVVTRNLVIVEADKENGVIKAEKRKGGPASGEIVGVFITRAQEGRGYTIEVLSKKRFEIQLAAQNWERTIVEGMKAELGV